MSGLRLLRSLFHTPGNAVQTADVSEARLESLRSLLSMAWFVEARDPYTGGHLWRVSRLSYLVAVKSGMDERWAARSLIGGFLHDLGKIGVPDAILRKPDRLTPEEYAVIQTHPGMGERLLSGHPLADLAMDAVRSHHERPDGKGYPIGMQGRDIPSIAAIVGVCDAFDAMTSHRPYRPGMPESRALQIIQQEMGQQFNAAYAQALLDLGHAGQLKHIIGHSEQGIPLYTCMQCGPTLVLTGKNKPDDRIFCRNCGGEYRVTVTRDGVAVIATGKMGKPSDLLPELNLAQVEATLPGARSALTPLLESRPVT